MTRQGDCFIIDFGDDENVTTDVWGSTMSSLLDEFEAVEGPRCLITTGSGKHYSNGLDVAFMAQASGEEIGAYVGRVCRIVYRIMLLDAPTVAAVNGHAFGLGAFLVLAHDQSVMRQDRGYWNLPEVHLSMSFPRHLMCLLDATMSAPVRRRAVATGHRYTGPEAVAAGIVDAVEPLESLVASALERGQALAQTAGPNLQLVKRQLFHEVAVLLDRSVETGR